MGLIKAAVGSINGTLADQWKEYFYCESLPTDVLVTKGIKRTSKRSSNTKGDENIISSGSVIAVADGQCMIIVEQGKVVELSSEPGAFTWDASTEPSIFASNLGTGIVNMFKTMWARFGFGGDTGKDQRVYYFNIKEILDNKFGTMNPVPFRCVDSKIGLDLDVNVKCCGTFSYKITNPILFYQNVCGNVSADYTRGQIDSQLKAEFISALQPGFGKLSELEMRPNQIVAHTTELEQAMNNALSPRWSELRGIEIVTIAITSLTLPKEDQDMIKQAQQTAIYRDPGMAGATLVQAQAQAMKDAANNKAGAMNGFFGVGMAQAAGGMNAQQFYNMQAQQQQAQQQQAAQAAAEAPKAPKADEWMCPNCHVLVSGKFCPECGSKKPVEAPKEGWNCPKCGTLNTGKFCNECGERRPAGAPVYKCDKCGWVPKDPHNPPKFCPECGDPFNDDDIQK